MRRARGFTVVEIMVSLALAGLVVAGAFEMHRAFNTQSLRLQQIAELQQTLRLADDVMARMIRAAGFGMNNTPVRVTRCAGPPQTYYPVQFSDTNVYLDPKLTFRNAQINSDDDPDWLRIVAGHAPDVGALQSVIAPTFYRVCDRRPFQGLGYVLVEGDPNGVGGPQPACLLSVSTIVYGGTPNCPYLGELRFQPGVNDPLCFNQTGCPNSNAKAVTLVQTPGGPSSMAVFRVDDKKSGVWDKYSPALRVSFDPPGTPSNTMTWNVVTENIENLQIALIRDDGTVWNSIDDPSVINLARVVAVKYTLVARAPLPLPGFTLGQSHTGDGIGGLENQTLQPDAANRGYLRRALTNVVEIRNRP